MKERGKAVGMYNNDLFLQDYSTSSSDLPCKKHPSASSVGVCAYCLKDRLVNLVCSDCGEQRLSSCSCSEISSNRNSCTVEVGSVGRISFLIENDQQKNRNDEFQISNSKSKADQKPVAASDDEFLLKRSSSSCVEIKRKSGFWKIGKFFSKKREKGINNCERNSVCGGVGFEDSKSDLWVVNYMSGNGVVSRSRSLCSFRGGFFGSEDGTFSGARSSISAARSSLSAARNSGVNGGLLFEPDRKSGFSEAEPRKSGFSEAEPRKSGFDGEKNYNISDHEKFDAGHTRRVFSLKEGNFTSVDDSGFIDLKFDFPSEAKPDCPSGLKMVSGGVLSDSNSAFGSMRGGDFLAQEHCGGHIGDGFCSNVGSCRIAVTDRGIKRSRKSFKSWRWIFMQHHHHHHHHHHHQHTSSKKRDKDLVVKANPT